MFSTNTSLSLSISIHRALMVIKSLPKFRYCTSYILFGTPLTCNQINHPTWITIKGMVDMERFLFTVLSIIEPVLTNLQILHLTFPQPNIPLSDWISGSNLALTKKSLIFLGRLKLTMGNMLFNKGDYSTNNCNSLRMRWIFNRAGW